MFWLEAVAVFAFGASWLIKGDTILKDRESDRKFDERIQRKAATG